MNLTYRQLLELIRDLPEPRKDDNVTILNTDDGEFKPISHACIEQDGPDVLDNDHLYLVM